MSERSEQPHYAAVGKPSGWYVRDMKVPHTEGEVCKAATRNNAEQIAAALNAAEQAERERELLKEAARLIGVAEGWWETFAYPERTTASDRCKELCERSQQWLADFAALQTEAPQ